VDDRLDLTGRAERAHFWFRGFRRFIAPVISGMAAGRRGLRLVDCGCGTGGNVALLSPHGRTFAFDVTPIGSQRTRTGTGVPAIQADITRIPFASKTFDIATSFDVLQMVEHDTDAVAEMARVVKPGGRVILTLAAHEVLRGDHAEVWQEVRRYTPESARALVERAGLRTERVSYLFASLFPLMLLVRLYQRLLRPYRGLRPEADITIPPAPVNMVLTWLVSGEAALAHRIPMPIGSSILVVARKP
jgi:ubiquinone/menaquinone biosynthesis C-methylase UbiE